jgi:hypothetical protein
VEPGQVSEDDAGTLAVEFATTDRRMAVGESKTIQFKLMDAGSGAVAVNVPDVSVLYYRADGSGRKVIPAQSIGDGVYEATVTAAESATYYVFVGAPSRGLDYSDQPFFSLMALDMPAVQKEEAEN